MGELLKDRILKIVGNERAMETSRAEFATVVEKSRHSFQSLMDSLYTDDLMEFHKSLQEEIDRPSFDASFEIACSNNPAISENARCAALRGGSVIPGRGARPSTETATDLFFLPIIGRENEIRAFLSEPRNLRLLETVFADAGVLRAGATLTLSETLISPESAVNATPGGLREVARAFQTFNSSRRSLSERENLEHIIEDFATICEGHSGVRTARGISTLLIPGSYAREYDLSSTIELDALTSQVARNDFGDEHKEALDGLSAALSNAAGFVVGRPAWLGRACAAAAVSNVMAVFEAEASLHGLDIGENGLDGVAIAQRGTSMLVEAILDGVSLGPVPYSNQLSALDPSYPVDAFGELAREEIPSGHLEHGRSAYLN